MTQGQQRARRALEAAEEALLIEYRWERAGHHWRHPKLPFTYTRKDALAETNANPLKLGYP